MNDYYVYIYWRLDINEPFYVGKGHNNRWKQLKRIHNKHFMNIVNKYPVACEITKDNLTESEAFYWEEFIINKLVFEYGFSIDIPNNKSVEKGYHLVNCTWGGEGTSGMNPYEMVNEEKREEWKRKISKASKEAWEDEELRKRVCESRKGENHPMYGKHHTEESKKKMSEVKKDKYIGKNNPRARSVICITTCKIFFTAKDGANFYNIRRESVKDCCGNRQKSAGKLSDGTKLIWMYLDDFLNKCKYTIL